MATVSKLIEALLKIEKESPDTRKVFVLTEHPLVYKIVKIREDHDRVFLDVEDE